MKKTRIVLTGYFFAFRARERKRGREREIQGKRGGEGFGRKKGERDTVCREKETDIECLKEREREIALVRER